MMGIPIKNSFDFLFFVLILNRGIPNILILMIDFSMLFSVVFFLSRYEIRSQVNDFVNRI